MDVTVDSRVCDAASVGARGTLSEMGKKGMESHAIARPGIGRQSRWQTERPKAATKNSNANSRPGIGKQLQWQTERPKPATKNSILNQGLKRHPTNISALRDNLWHRSLSNYDSASSSSSDSSEIVFMLENTPHDWLFPRCSAVVHHGGAGTTAIGLRCGKSTMIVPFFGDQPFWGSSE